MIIFGEIMMKLEKINFSDIQPNEYNPRKISKDEKQSLIHNLKEFGLVDPIIINLKNNHIIGGHQRYEALKEIYGNKTQKHQLNLIKLGDIGWVFEDKKLTVTDQTHEKTLNISLNKISGEWDYDKLSELFEEIDKEQYNIELTGFDSFEIEQIKVPPTLKEEFEKIPTINIPLEKNEDGSENIATEENKSDELLVNEDIEDNSVEKKAKYKCPKCGYEWN